MNKAELVKEMAFKSGLTQKDCSLALEAFIATVGDVVGPDEEIRIQDFGAFYLKQRKASNRVLLGREVKIPERNSVGFRAGKGLKDAVN